jgi:hypothetical protein
MEFNDMTDEVLPGSGMYMISFTKISGTCARMPDI